MQEGGRDETLLRRCLTLFFFSPPALMEGRTRARAREMFVSAYVLARRFKRKRRTRAGGLSRVPLYAVFAAITYSYVDTNDSRRSS